jgi:hypothetical protein
MKLIEKHEYINRLKLDEIPHIVIQAFGHIAKQVSVTDNEICLGEDFLSVDEAREAIAWYVDQLGGKVTWSKK